MIKEIEAILEAKGLSTNSIILVSTPNNTTGWRNFCLEPEKVDNLTILGRAWQLIYHEINDHSWWEFIEKEPPIMLDKESASALYLSILKTQVLDSLYNCYKGGLYARGSIVGLVSGLMSTGWTFAAVLEVLKIIVVKRNETDLTEEMVINCLPDSWKAAWEKII